MTSPPPPTEQTPTILLPSLPQNSLVGIDLLTFTSTPRFTGIKSLPPGPHFVFAGASASLSSRCGFWFVVPASPSTTAGNQKGHTPVDANEEPFIRIWAWNSENEELGLLVDERERERWRERLGERETQEKLVEYSRAVEASASAPASTSAEVEAGAVANGDEAAATDVPATLPESERVKATDWGLLISHVMPELLSRLCCLPSAKGTGGAQTGEGWIISTTSTGVLDREDIPGLEGKWEGERQLGFLAIDLKRTWREGAVGEERTRGARDRSWALEEVVEHGGKGKGKGIWGDELLGEMQVCFLMVLLLANYSCLEQWKRILGLVLTCREALESRTDFFVEFMKTLGLQLRHCNDVEGGLFEISEDGGNYLKVLLKGFRRTVEEVCTGKDSEVTREMGILEDYLRQEWDWEISDSFLRRGMVQLEDGENVELEVSELEGEDERGEYAPVVVDEGSLG